MIKVLKMLIILRMSTLPRPMSTLFVSATHGEAKVEQTIAAGAALRD